MVTFYCHRHHHRRLDSFSFIGCKYLQDQKARPGSLILLISCFNPLPFFDLPARYRRCRTGRRGHRAALRRQLLERPGRHGDRNRSGSPPAARTPRRTASASAVRPRSHRFRSLAVHAIPITALCVATCESPHPPIMESPSANVTRWVMRALWVAHASRVLVSASRRNNLFGSPRKRDAFANTRDACATRKLGILPDSADGHPARLMRQAEALSSETALEAILH